MKIVDISRKLERGIPTWPGDTPFTFEISWPMEESGSVNVGRLVMSTHTGTHIDAPYHFDNEGKKIYDLDLELYIGPARVVDMQEKEYICAADLKEMNLDGMKRMLFRTNSWENASRFPKKITYLHPDLGPFLAEKGILLIGVDVPSVDPLDSKELPAHHSLNRHGIHILEGIDLEGVQTGDYELIALPLPLAEADGSPVRAVLRPLETK
ncbi:MAG: arylformamidase [Bacillota bacterium]|nr:arylformamidase [Bacillota bacterium]